MAGPLTTFGYMYCRTRRPQDSYLPVFHDLLQQGLQACLVAELGCVIWMRIGRLAHTGNSLIHGSRAISMYDPCWDVGVDCWKAMPPAELREIRFRARITRPGKPSRSRGICIYAHTNIVYMAGKAANYIGPILLV
ncbi:hypothetical protein CPSG_10214 [Coccidioides posadasii str. Silveira]|uniref:Uncharacterized protein n=1 Tax=Coccidioides posadasii (strain RMSCC 757 / Silveira) TaxID=443226 RepID=E9DK65_COCPS|nr:hypothetical protein CPSG_10214 [Coccidioides posadasii str. Silveira]